MCGIVGVMSTDGFGPVGAYLIDSLEALQHRGKDSVGVAVYNAGYVEKDAIKLHVLTKDVVGALGKVATAIASVHGDIRNIAMGLYLKEGYSYDSIEIVYKGSIKHLYDAVESTGVARVVSIGRRALIYKYTTTVREFNGIFNISGFQGSHGIGHVRFSTESGVDIFHAHPFQDLENPDITVVHNGQITNYWKLRSLLEMKGVEFLTDNDSELIVHYVAYKMSKGLSLEAALKDAINVLEGPFAFIIATPDEIGVACDRLGLRPLVIGISDTIHAAASEERALQVLESKYNVKFRKKQLNSGEVVVWRLKR
ncbi:MAG: hypothetical protein QW348_05910 [Ignisphaera sp.]